MQNETFSFLQTIFNKLPCRAMAVSCFFQSSASSSCLFLACSFSSSDTSAFLRSFFLAFRECLVLAGVEVTIGLTEDVNSVVRNDNNIGKI